MSLKMMTSDIAIKWRSQGNVLYPDHPTKLLQSGQFMDEADVDALGSEAIWRIGSSRVIVLPSLLVVTMLIATETAEKQHATDQIKEYQKRADVLLVPIVTSSHWVLLALESGSPAVLPKDRKAMQKPMDVDVIDPVPLEPGGKVGCGQCRYTDSGCTACEKNKHIDQEARRLEMRHALFPLEMEPVERDANAGWLVRYYDSLRSPSMSCRASAAYFLKCLGLEPIVPHPNNSLFQKDGFSCGFWVRHYIEEEARRYSREGMWTQRFTLGARVYDWLNQIRARFCTEMSDDEKRFAGEHDFKQ